MEFRCNYQASITLAAGVAQAIDIPIDGAADWSVVVRNTGSSNAVTAASLALSPLGTLFGAAASITDGIPLAAGASLAPVIGTNQPVKTARLTLTSTSGTTVSIEAGGR
jgi:hypothetical protein